ncbi:MAG: enoyl-CoA hydratase/isomerase family protein [Gammaproteobacteria bacterium]|nr:enoyl-CoA hydratase/isomerase family protein [Gammaproteobacteria bacterium]MDE0367996.1 enoyl-CoA hydratase/isomerase family protein [Gammaproteobacteria bacterium]
MEHCLTPSQLLALTIEPNWARDDPDRRCLLAVRLESQSHLDPDETARLSAWLAQQPIPVIGVGEDRASSLVCAVDVVVDTASELELLKGQIEKYPRACAVLVQVLRATGELDPLAGLAMESMAYAALQGGAEFARWLEERPPMQPKSRSAENLVLLERDGDNLRIVLNCPENRNALSAPMRDALTDAFRLAVQDSTINSIDVSARGPCFSAGGDLSEFGTMTDLARAHSVRMTHMPARYLAACRERCTFHLHGACIGAGIELPAFAARLVAKPDTTFRLPEVSMGLIPGAGGCVSIPRRIGRQQTARMAILGETVTAEQALGWGLIDEIAE